MENNFIYWVVLINNIVSGLLLAKMIELYNIQLQGSKKLFGKQTRRFIRISQSNAFSHNLENNMGKSKTTAKYINESTIEWSNPIMFKPILGE